MESALDLLARAFLYTTPYEGSSVGVFFEKEASAQMSWLAGAAGVQALFMYLFILFKRPEFSKAQWKQFSLFSIPALVFSFFGPEWISLYGARAHAWAWLAGAGLLFIGFRQHLDSFELPKNLREAQRASKKIEAHSGLSLVKKALIASLIALPLLGVNGLTYAGGVLVLLCVFRVSARRAWLISLIIAAPSLFVKQLVESPSFFNGKPLDFLPVVIVYLIGTFLAFTGASIVEKIFLAGKERQLAFAQMVPAMIVLAYTAHFEKRHVFSGMPVMGTEAKLILWGDEREANNARNEMLEIYDDINNSLSLYKDDSEINIINKNAHKKPMVCSDLLWENLVLAKEMYEITDGHFDVTVGPLMNLWGFYAKKGEAPNEQEINKVMEITGFNKVILDEQKQTVFFKVEGMVLDFGGITKGYAVDRVVKMLANRNYDRGLVDLGGNIRVLQNSPPDRDFYPLGIRDPRDVNQQITRVDLLNNSISTSGNYERYVVYNDVRYPHIINPNTGRPQMGVDSVSVLASEAVYADALSTAFFLGGKELLDKLSHLNLDLSVMMLDFDDNGNLQDSFLAGPAFEDAALNLKGDK